MSVIPIDQAADPAAVDHLATRKHEQRYRLVVATLSAADTVVLGGGWLFDRVMAGWRVTVLTVDPAAAASLRILGADVARLDKAAVLETATALPHSFAFTAAAYESDPRIRHWALRALDRGGHEVTLWGEDCPAELNRRTSSARHRLSFAARAFKARALQAAATADPVAGEFESFRSAGSPPRTAPRPRPR